MEAQDTVEPELLMTETKSEAKFLELPLKEVKSRCLG